MTHNYKVKDIGELLDLEPTSISKEVKRNRVPMNLRNDTESSCDKLKQWPYVYNNCKNRYGNCPYVKFKYDAKIAQRIANANLINSRKGIDLDDTEFKELDKIIKNGINNDKSLYQIKIENKDKINKSITTLYRYVNKGYLKTKRIDLPYTVKYKKRKHNKKYDYSDNYIDRSNHTYLDYLVFIHENPRVNVWQLDFLGSIKTDSKAILSIILTEVHFTLIDLIKNPTSQKVVKFFDDLEEKIGTKAFIELIPAILTNRDP